MAQGETRGIRPGTIALVLALALVGGAVAYKTLSAGGGAATSGSDSPGAAADPLAALEARTRENPGDDDAWLALGNAWFEQGRFAEAVPAFATAAEIAPSARSWSSLGEARVMASERDPMPAAAVADFERAIGLDPKDPRARYFLAVRQDLSGDHRGAIDAWLALLADTPPGAPWEADLRRTIEQVGKINRIAVAQRLAAVRQPPPTAPTVARAIPGPTAAELQQASAMRPAEQREMAEGMVARLETKLRTDPRNVDGWIMLIRSRVTLGEPDKAKAALAAAIAANPGSAAKLREQAALLGVR
ncbi:MAG: tetratricopeptide repeat protein [Novosphingobium sp.]